MPRRARRRQWGFGSLQRLAGGRWKVQWRTPAGRRSQTFTGQDLAERFLRQRVAAGELAAAGLPKDPTATPTLGELVPPWLDARRETHRSHGDDRSRWTLHLAPALGKLRPDQVDAGVLRRLILDRLAAGLSSSTVRLLVRLLSTLYSDLIDDGHAARNPVADLPRKHRKLIRPAHDPTTTPYIESRSDIWRLFDALPEPAHMAFAIGVMAGLRTGEILALRWSSVDLERRVIHVRESIGGPLKDDESRFVLILDDLLPLLETWRRRCPADAIRVIPPLRARARCMSPHALGAAFADAAKKVGLDLTFYQATRHTFASHWVLSGRSLESLRELLGHSSITTTERYAHLRPDRFGATVYAALTGTEPPHNGTRMAPAMKGLRGKVIDVSEEESDT